MFLLDTSGAWDMATGILTRLIWVLVGGLIIWTRRNVYFYMITKRKLYHFFTGKKYIIIWNDDSPEISQRIKTQLDKRKIPGRYKYKIIKSPDALLYFPSSPRQVHLVLLIVTDVTKLDENQKRRDEIETKLIDYVSAGGVLVGTHDIIYRRCRNVQLQKSFGCVLTKFQTAANPIKVKLVDKYASHPLLTGLKPAFEIKDGEIVYGKWDSDVQQLVQTEKDVDFGEGKCKVPVVCVNNHVHDGALIWFSSGDKSDQVSDSVRMPEDFFVQLLANAIQYNKEIKAFPNV